MDVLVPEGHGPSPMLQVRGPEDLRPGLGQPLDRVAGKLLLMFPHGVHPQGLQVVDGGHQRHLLGDVHGPRLELPGRILERRAVLFDPHDHLAAAQERIHPVQQLPPAVEPARRGGAEHLVPGDGEEVDVDLGDVHRRVRDQLGPVHQDDRPHGVRCVGEPAERRHGPEDVRHAGHGDNLGALGEQRVEPREVERAVLCQGNEPETRSRRLGRELPRDQVRVVLDHREQDPSEHSHRRPGSPTRSFPG